METVGIMFIGVAALVLLATQIVFFVAGRRQNVDGVEGENLRLQPKKVARIGVLTALALVVLGGVIVAIGATVSGGN